MDRRLSGIVLAGGQSRRMGRDKAALPFGGTTLVAWVARRLSSVCAEVIVVARDAADCAGCGARVVGDRWPGWGPLGGLATGLEASTTVYGAVIACDLPFVEPGLLLGLAGLAQGGWDAVVPSAGGDAQPLCAVYRRSVGQPAETLLRTGGRSLRDLLATPSLRVCHVPEWALREWDPALQSFENINTPEEYERAKTLVSGWPLAPA
ncbi:MAG: molybdenum cofactor guanylyltransferase [Candidatus Methylomirabilaceae bacterium]